MSRFNRLDNGDGHAEGPPPTVDETVDQANRAIEGARAEVARAQALRRSVGDLARELERIGREQAGPSAEEKPQDG